MSSTQLQGNVQSYAGSETKGNRDGVASEASFTSISGMTVDARTGALYMTTLNNNIRKISAEGIVSTYAGRGDEGSEDGPASEATFNSPHGITVDNDANLFVVEDKKIRKIDSDGKVTTFAGSGVLGKRGTNTDGVSSVATFREAYSVAVNKKDGSVYVADTGNHSIRKISNGSVTTIAGTGAEGFADGPGTAAKFSSPEGIVVNESDGSVFVADKGNNRIRKISPEGIVSTWAGQTKTGYQDGTSTQALFYGPTEIVIDNNGALYVADQWWTVIRKISPSGEVSTVAGQPNKSKSDGSLQEAGFNRITSLAWYNNIIYVAEHNEIRKVTLL